LKIAVAGFEKWSILNRLAVARRGRFWPPAGINERIMAIPKDTKHEDYTRYAAHCLTLVTSIKNQEDRAINREMAAEWLKLADSVRRPSRRKQMQMG
jgi:hypothetical protein